ncbi:DUF4112 domain-containing protein [Caulobacter hibisci]|uniref:DUF4112 domain-containing protein n=1 Tax=Caulobacter hibisci TaxID=2035993 RepID=A0ABS0T297_9CAUL|nr:DUF4112 domain-containing protein [Caulobacter hibisci]MBI1685784.1 DUF4112 domain-containing protein [Caulobacter hibisci]
MTDEAAFQAEVIDEGPAAHRRRAHKAWRNAETIKRLSDRLIGIGPIGIGLDGVLAWVPGANTAYTLGAAGLLAYHAVQAKASAATLARMAAYILFDSSTSAVPGLGWAIDTLFPGHLMAAKALQKDIEARHGLPDDVDPKRRKKVKPKVGKR